MTFQPPPPPPDGEQPPPPPTSPGYGQPPAPRSQGFDPKSVNPLDWGIMGAGVLAFIFSFVSYYTASLSNGSQSLSHSWTAWHGFFGWFSVLAALVGSAAVAMHLFAPQVKLNAPPRMIGLVAYAVSALCVIIAIFVVPIEGPGSAVLSIGGVSFDKGHGFGFWISLIVILAGLVMSLMRFQQGGGQLPGALSKIPNIGDKAPGGQSHGGGTPPPPPPPAG